MIDHFLRIRHAIFMNFIAIEAPINEEDLTPEICVQLIKDVGKDYIYKNKTRIVALQDTIKAQQDEIAKLRRLLKRWETQGKYTKDCFDGHNRWESEALIRLKNDTTKALK